MNDRPEAVIISTSPSSDRLDVALARYLGKNRGVCQWLYNQPDPDRAVSTQAVLFNLENYLAPFDAVHLIGHSINGMLAFLYSQKFPDRVKSLTLLAVGKNMAMNWVSQYYFNLHFLPICRECLLKQMAINLFGKHPAGELNFYINLLGQDLNRGFSPHSPLNLTCQRNEQIPVPLLVCGSEDDFICDPDSLYSWQMFLKSTDRLCLFSSGRHFFHHFQVEAVGRTIESFWQTKAGLQQDSSLTFCSEKPTQI